MPMLAFIVSSSNDMIQLSIVSTIILLSIAATYAYNSLKDIKEDRYNLLHANPLKESKLDAVVEKAPYVLFILVLIISLLFTNIYSFSLFLYSITFSLIYSKFKIKRFFLIKTISISFCYMILFFSCYLAFSTDITYEMLITGILMYILMFSYSILADIRDIEPDKKYNFITIPVRYGYKTSMTFVMYLFVLFNILITLFYGLNAISLKLATIFYMFIPFEVYMLYYLQIHNLGDIENVKSASFFYIAIFMGISLI